MSDRLGIDTSHPSTLAPQGGVRIRRAASRVIARSVEMTAIEEGIEEARHGISGLSLEGEPGIGKSRLLAAAAEIAAAHEFVPVSVSADEEIRGPFMLARAIVDTDALRDGAGERVIAALGRAEDILSGNGEVGLEGLTPEDRLMRVIDQVALALRTVARERPIALLLDDLQWADQDSIRLLRYIVRTQPSLPIFMAIAMRPEESALVPELVTLLADMDRMGVVRRLRVSRFRQNETSDMLQLVLAGPIAPRTAAAIHAQAEGVPFVIEELARTYREAGLVQIVDGSWTLAANAARMVPSSVRTLVQRRAAHLREDTREVLAEAAILGRSFRLADVCAVRAEMGSSTCTPDALADLVAPAVDAGLLTPTSERSGVDYTFSHAQVHEFAAGWLPAARRRAIHAAVVDLLSAGEGTPPAMLTVLARHALAAGDADRAAAFSIQAAAGALSSSAPEESLRLIEDALAVVSTRRERVALLRIRDDAFDMLRRVDDRLEGLTELAALADASGDSSLGSEVMLRRAAALRMDEQYDTAAELARRVRGAATESGDWAAELAACLELGQDLIRSSLGEGYSPTPLESDFDGAEEAYQRAAEIAEQHDDQRGLAAASRELGVISGARVRAWFIAEIKVGGHMDVVRHVADGGRLDVALASLPIMPLVRTAAERLQRALELFDSLGDRRGAMSTIIAMAYLSWGADVHVGGSPARRIEEIRRLATRLRSMSHETERAAAEAQLLYGVHVFCRSKVIPDLAVARGREAHERARAIGDRMIEFMAAGGTALAYLDLGDVPEAGRWLDRASSVATTSPTPARARQLEQWRATLSAAEGDIVAMRLHVGRALELAASQDRRAARCEILAGSALQVMWAVARADTVDPGLLDEAERHALESQRLAADLPGHAPWAAQAASALAAVAAARDQPDLALERARAALTRRREALREDPHLEILLPAARIVLARGDESEKAELRDELRILQAMIGQRTLDGDVRAEWFRGPHGRDLSSLAGPYVATQAVADEGSLPTQERQLLGLLVEGRTNGEIASELGLAEQAVDQALAAMYARIGARSRADATVLALTGAV